MKWRFSLALAVVAGLSTAPVWAGDWPQFRYDAGRTAASPHELPAAALARPEHQAVASLGTLHLAQDVPCRLLV